MYAVCMATDCKQCKKHPPCVLGCSISFLISFRFVYSCSQWSWSCLGGSDHEFSRTWRELGSGDRDDRHSHGSTEAADRHHRNVFQKMRPEAWESVGPLGGQVLTLVHKALLEHYSYVHYRRGGVA